MEPRLTCQRRFGSKAGRCYRGGCDIVVVASTSITAGNWRISAIVNAANQVTVSIENVTGSTVDLGSGTVNVRVLKP